MAVHILHININSLKSKRQLLTEYMEECSPDIVLINESKLANEDRIRFAKYKMARKDRDKRGGGVAILIKENIKHSIIDSSNLTEEVLGIEISINQQPMAVVALYNPPAVKLNPEVFKYFTDKYENCLFIGDFNSKHQYFGCRTTNLNGNILFDIAEEHDLHIMNDPSETTHLNKATGNADILDMAFATNSVLNRVTDCYVGEDLGSDHLPLHIKVGANRQDVAQHPILIRNNINKANWAVFNEHIEANLRSNDLTTCEEIDQACLEIEQVINRAADLACPKIKSCPKVWRVSNETLKLIKLKRKLRRTAQKSGNPIHRHLYNYINKRVKAAIKLEKQQSWEHTTTEFGNSAMNRSFWNTFRTLSGINSSKGTVEKPVLDSQGHLTTNDSEKATAFANKLSEIHNTHVGPIFDDHFRTFVEKYVNDNEVKFKPLEVLTNEADDAHITLKTIEINEIDMHLKQCRSNSSPGEDNISFKLLKKCPIEIKSRLKTIYNVCLRIGYFPTCWKEAVGVMIPKPNKDTQVTTNHRPISLLRCIGKMFERVLAHRIRGNLEEKEFFNKWQRAYRDKKEGIEHILRLVEHAQLGHNRNWITAAVLLDVEKAFDSVWHAGLKYKLAHCKLPTKIVRILSSFLDDRTIKVRVQQQCSNSVKLNAGTPQGSVLSPLLFLIYVNDLPIHPANKVEASQFADDLGLWTTHKQERIVQKRLQATLTDLELWCSLWRIKLNAGKTQLIVFNRRTRVPAIRVTLFNQVVQQFDQVTLLGMTLDKRLTLKAHFEAIRQKANKRITLLCRLRGTNWGASQKCLVRLYKAYIRPVLEYGAIILAAANKTRLAQLQLIQNRALRICLRMPKYTRIRVLHELANIEPIRQRLENLGRKTISRIRKSELFSELKVHNAIYKVKNKCTTLDKYTT